MTYMEKPEPKASTSMYVKMKIIEKIYRFIFRKNFLLFTVAVFGIIIFRKPFESFISKTVVKHLLSEIDSVWYNNLIFFNFEVKLSPMYFFQFELF